MSEENIWQLFVRGIQGKTTVLRIHKDASVDQLMKKISDTNGIGVTEQRILFTSKQLEYGKGKYLTDYRIQNESNLFVVLRLKGGSRDEPKQLDEDIELTTAPDMISWDDDPENKRAKMPCGHAIGPESLTAYCRSLLDAGKFRFLCPYIGNNTYCGKEWAYFNIRRLAVLTKEEIKIFETKITDNYLRKACGIQECPKCHSFCERESTHDRRVICPFCSKDGNCYEFCWYCLHNWKSTGTAKCGNAECSGEDPRLKILRDAPKKTIVGAKNCPCRRACPSCGMIIEHTEACKHMVCPCGQKFCFICLMKAATSGSYQCGSYNTPCSVAAVQTTVPGS